MPTQFAVCFTVLYTQLLGNVQGWSIRKRAKNLIRGTDRRRQKWGKLLYCKAWQPRPVATAAAVGGSAGWSETLGPHPTSHSPRLHPAHSPACGDASLSAACAPTTPAWTNVKFNQRVHTDVWLKKFLNISQFQDHLPRLADCSNTHTIWTFSHCLIKNFTHLRVCLQPKLLWEWF